MTCKCKCNEMKFKGQIMCIYKKRKNNWYIFIEILKYSPLVSWKFWRLGFFVRNVMGFKFLSLLEYFVWFWGCMRRACKKTQPPYRRVNEGFVLCKLFLLLMKWAIEIPMSSICSSLFHLQQFVCNVIFWFYLLLVSFFIAPLDFFCSCNSFLLSFVGPPFKRVIFFPTTT